MPDRPGDMNERDVDAALRLHRRALGRRRPCRTPTSRRHASSDHRRRPRAAPSRSPSRRHREHRGEPRATEAADATERDAAEQATPPVTPRARLGRRAVGRCRGRRAERRRGAAEAPTPRTTTAASPGRRWQAPPRGRPLRAARRPAAAAGGPAVLGAIVGLVAGPLMLLWVAVRPVRRTASAGSSVACWSRSWASACSSCASRSTATRRARQRRPRLTASSRRQLARARIDRCAVANFSVSVRSLARRARGRPRWGGGRWRRRHGIRDAHLPVREHAQVGRGEDDVEAAGGVSAPGRSGASGETSRSGRHANSRHAPPVSPSLRSPASTTGPRRRR